MTLMDLFEKLGLPAPLGLLLVFALFLLIVIFMKIKKSVSRKPEALNAAQEKAVLSSGTRSPGGVIAAISAAVNEYQKNEIR